MRLCFIEHLPRATPRISSACVRLCPCAQEAEATQEEGGKQAAGGKARQGPKPDLCFHLRYLSFRLRYARAYLRAYRNARGIPAEAWPSHLPEMRSPNTRRHAMRRSDARAFE